MFFQRNWGCGHAKIHSFSMEFGFCGRRPIGKSIVFDGNWWCVGGDLCENTLFFKGFGVVGGGGDPCETTLFFQRNLVFL